MWDGIADVHKNIFCECLTMQKRATKWNFCHRVVAMQRMCEKLSNGGKSVGRLHEASAKLFKIECGTNLIKRIFRSVNFSLAFKTFDLPILAAIRSAPEKQTRKRMLRLDMLCSFNGSFNYFCFAFVNYRRTSVEIYTSESYHTQSIVKLQHRLHYHCTHFTYLNGWTTRLS